MGTLDLEAFRLGRKRAAEQAISDPNKTDPNVESGERQNNTTGTEVVGAYP